MNSIKRTCKTHGYVEYKYKEDKNKNKHWYVCSLCLKSQWRKAQEKRRKAPESKLYHKEYNTLNTKIRKSLSIYLTMILIAAKIKPD